MKKIHKGATFMFNATIWEIVGSVNKKSDNDLVACKRLSDGSVANFTINRLLRVA